tara:strand:+ start:25 stop:360 length:336 start_codon:yes stop_codon:yes gene_type:complete
MVAGEPVHADSQLVLIRGAAGSLPHFLGPAQFRQEHASKYGNDCDHDEPFDESESGWPEASSSWLNGGDEVGRFSGDGWNVTPVHAVNPGHSPRWVGTALELASDRQEKEW